MADPLSITASIIGIVSLAAKTSDGLQNFRQFDREVDRIQLDVNISLHKLEAWQKNWLGQLDSSRPPARVLWGDQGWKTILLLLNTINKQSEALQTQLRELEYLRENKPRTRWKRAIRLAGKKKRNNQQHELRDCASLLNKLVDQLWIFSESAFDSRHGLLELESTSTGHRELLQWALESRAGSLELYHRCLSQTEDCNLEMNLCRSNVSELRYGLVVEPEEKQLRKMLVVSTKEEGTSKDTIKDPVEPSAPDLQWFEPNMDLTIVTVPYGDAASYYSLRIAKAGSETSHLDRSPESLESMLKQANNPTHVTSEVYLDMEAKIELAFKITDCGLFLLGTPWFSSLSSKNLRELKSSTDEQHPAFMLRTQTLDLKDLVSDDPGALVETSQLFRIGVLLMEIALDSPDLGAYTNKSDYDPTLTERLSLVEKAMGYQYCTATTFCLQYQNDSQFAGPDKYNTKLHGEWETYLIGFLADYHSQVYLRLLELHRLGRGAN